MKPRIVFCDFDGTITEQETFVAVLKQYSPTLAAECIPQIYALKMTLREGVRKMLEAIPAAAYPEILAFAKTQPQRSGFPEFLTFLQQHQTPCVIISGGLKGMVEAALGNLTSHIEAIYAVDVDTTGDRFQVYSPAEGETEFVSKVDLMQRHPCQEKIVIGDSVTDLQMALAGDMVFARDRLAQYLAERSIPHHLWQDFSDIQDILRRKWEEA
jgi:2-hydroxy-3-keto-5-methylthiopentenyl-1-phosphate phosphatase